jgi:hypothetical protein
MACSTTRGLAALVLMAASTGASAAPDNTLGMAILSAVVDTNGNLVSGSGVADSELISGVYYVTFERAVTSCAYLATVGLPVGGFSQVGYTVQTTRNVANDRVVNVLIKNTGDISVTRAFNLLVFCPR